MMKAMALFVGWFYLVLSMPSLGAKLSLVYFILSGLKTFICEYCLCVICRLKRDKIEQVFQSWISSFVAKTGYDIIAIDGKTARCFLPKKEIMRFKQ